MGIKTRMMRSDWIISTVVRLTEWSCRIILAIYSPIDAKILSALMSMSSFLLVRL